MKKFLLVIAIALALLLISGAVLVTGNQAAPFPEGSQSAAWLRPGPHEVRSYEQVFIDSSRPTAANGEYAGEDHRRLEGRVWHPAHGEGGPYPLVVYSHGFTSSRDGGAYIAEHLASHGYVVVAVNYPLTNMYAPGGPNVKDVVNQPGDVSFLIDSLLAQSATPDHVLDGMIDAARIGVTGISLGGLTSTLVAFHPDMADERVAASLSIAGPTALFTPAFFRHRDVPFLMLAGDIDAMVPYPSNAAPVPELVPGGELVTVANASHTGFAGPAAFLRWMHNPDALGCFMVLRNVDEAGDEAWFDLLGTPEQGINYDFQNELCLTDPLPGAMNPLRQHMITLVTVLGFFESRFAAEAQRREQARGFLHDVLPAELAEVEFTARGSG
jgi:dienelactone hydrolase